MSDEIARSEHNVKLVNLNWGYQVSYTYLVLEAIFDTVGGPHRTEACSQEAKAAYEKWCRFYERVFSGPRKPTLLQLNMLYYIMKGESKRVNGNTLKALHGRGVIRLRPEFQLSGSNWCEDWEPVHV